jgi:hypothetical protein
VAKRQRRLGGIDDLVISLTAKGLTTGEVAAHLAEVYGATVSKDLAEVLRLPCVGRPGDHVNFVQDRRRADVA